MSLGLVIFWMGLSVLVMTGTLCLARLVLGLMLRWARPPDQV